MHAVLLTRDWQQLRRTPPPGVKVGWAALCQSCHGQALHCSKSASDIQAAPGWKQKERPAAVRNMHPFRKEKKIIFFKKILPITMFMAPSV